MSVRLAGDAIVLEGPCRVEDAEPLLSLLQAGPDRTVDLTEASHLHAAVVQVLMALRPTLKGTGQDGFLKTWIIPALIGAESGDTPPEDG
ncbi:hypothetical protein [Microvirga pakistanensis]|uniref:hypothetical protein n=1 Tax=Microvirga pakistanensis TaxID=1682650 RepID=UPI00106B6E10|nr:hypothetical protein [Microvirga pakistanensis]